MEDRKPIQVMLFLAVMIQGLYLLSLIGMMVFYRPVLRWYGANYVEVMNRPMPYLFLCGSVVVFFCVSCFAYWIYIRVKRSDTLLLPCILSFVLVGVSPIVNYIFTALENVMSKYLELEQMVLHVSIVGAYAFVYPVCMASMVLLAIAAALALYRKRYVVIKSD